MNILTKIIVFEDLCKWDLFSPKSIVDIFINLLRVCLFFPSSISLCDRRDAHVNKQPANRDGEREEEVTNPSTVGRDVTEYR